MRLKAIEFVQNRASRSSKFQDNDLAKELKKVFDETFFPTWQCVVGKNFGSDISFEENHMLYFHFNSTAILIWKAGWALTLNRLIDQASCNTISLIQIRENLGLVPVHQTFQNL